MDYQNNNTESKSKEPNYAQNVANMKLRTICFTLCCNLCIINENN
jgi:hypothetical protein